jgi:hypothetical protein
LCLSGTALAGQKHPGYVRTEDDLRLARALLQRTSGNQPESGSQDEVSLTVANIDNALAQIDEEVGAEHKKSHAVPRINPRMAWGDRLAESLRLVERAKEDCSKEKENGGDAGLHARILNLLEQSHTRLTVAIQTKNFDYSARNLPTRND